MHVFNPCIYIIMCFLFQREDWMLSSSLLDVAAKATYSREHGKTKQRKEEERKKETETRKVSNCDSRISYLSQTGLCSAPSFRVVMSKVLWDIWEISVNFWKPKATRKSLMDFSQLILPPKEKEGYDLLVARWQCQPNSYPFS